MQFNGIERKAATIKKVSFVSQNKVNLENGLYGNWLLESINLFEPGLLNQDVNIRNDTIAKIRGKDEIWKILQGVIYAPFIEDNRKAIQSLQGHLNDCRYLFSLERGGSLLADQIAKGKNLDSDKIEKMFISEEDLKSPGNNKLDNYKVQQQENLKARITSLMQGKENENITIAVAETIVGGGSTNELVKTLEALLKAKFYPNLKFKLLLLQQTIHRKDEGKGVILRKRAASEQIQLILSQTRYILGEDVGYQLAYSGQTSKKPIIVFQGTQEKLVAYQITPEGNTIARDIIIDLNAGAYTGLLPDIL